MKSYFLTTLILFTAAISAAQQDRAKDIFAFRITDYIVKLSDSTAAVQVDLTQGSVGIEENQVAVLKSNFSNGDTVTLGAGKCNLIKGAYYYFGIRLTDKKRLPKKGDLIFTQGNYPVAYKGQIYHLIRYSIYLQHVTGGTFYSFAFPVFGDKNQESSVIDSLEADIHYTGREMLQQNDGQDKIIATGRFKNKKIFTAMQQITNTDVTDFLDYMIARPRLYAGNDWKIAEVFATWMDGGAPTVIKE